MDKLKTVQANSSLPLPQPTLSVAGFRSDNGMCFNLFALFTIFESIIYRVYVMIYHLRRRASFLTLQESLLTNFQLIRKDIADPPCIQMKNRVFPALTAVRAYPAESLCLLSNRSMDNP